MLDPQSSRYSVKGYNLLIYLRQRPNRSENTKLLCPKQCTSWVMTSRTNRLEAVNTRGRYQRESTNTCFICQYPNQSEHQAILHRMPFLMQPSPFPGLGLAPPMAPITVEAGNEYGRRKHI
jgi:hypothetical protein